MQPAPVERCTPETSRYDPGGEHGLFTLRIQSAPLPCLHTDQGTCEMTPKLWPKWLCW